MGVVQQLRKQVDVCELEKVLQAGANITITKVDNCTLEISSTGGASSGIQYHLKDGDVVTVKECFQYLVYCTDFILDENSIFVSEVGSQLIIEDGCLILDGCLVLNGCLKYKD